ncbi:MAG: hypothetical protein HY093_04630 [Candidatus Liptonbacteria bacterium]|nr:hypothetical protein [Candidatus Liptonbacteria bacterium]
MNLPRTALLSVYNKEGIIDFAKSLVDLNFKIIASGGTARVLKEAGLAVSDVADWVGGGAILGHRVVTLSREIYAGLLSQNNEPDNAEMKLLNIPRIDLVCCDLYPLQETIEKCTLSSIESKTVVGLTALDAVQGGTKLQASRTIEYDERRSNGSNEEMRQRCQSEVIEKTDIGGPTLLRAAAKGRRIVICDPADRTKVIDWLKNGESKAEEYLSFLASKAEFTVANYALASARYHSAGKYDGFLGEKTSQCKYGENGWQAPASLMQTPPLNPDPLSLSNFVLTAGTAPSYNNLCDLDRLLQTATHIMAGLDINSVTSPYLALGAKHGNTCGAAVGDNQILVIQKMLDGDLRAIFGGVVLLNFEIDANLAEVLLTYRIESGRRLLDGIIAPSFTNSAIDLLKRKGDKCRFLTNPALLSLSQKSLDNQTRFRYVRGGFLKQPNYTFILDFKNPDLQTNTEEINSATPVIPGLTRNPDKELSDQQKQNIILAWAIGSTSNSNTITIIKDGQLLGNGVGQQDRVSGCELAIKRAKDAGHNLMGAVAYSDSFFPFTDGPKILIEAGITTILATRGSVKDEEVKKFCLDQKVKFITLPDSLARGFFGH